MVHDISRPSRTKHQTDLTYARKIANDPDNYTYPSKFDPERFLGNSPELDPTSFVFGFGRRRCPGIELARTTCLLIMASGLSVLDIVKAKNEEGLEQMPSREFISSTVWCVCDSWYCA